MGRVFASCSIFTVLILQANSLLADHTHPYIYDIKYVGRELRAWICNCGECFNFLLIGVMEIVKIGQIGALCSHVLEVITVTISLPFVFAGRAIRSIFVRCRETVPSHFLLDVCLQFTITLSCTIPCFAAQLAHHSIISYAVCRLRAEHTSFLRHCQ